MDVDLLGLSSETYTFISEAHGSKRWLDHCITTKAAISSVMRTYVEYNVLWSDHFPLVMECSLDTVLPRKLIKQNMEENHVLWGERNSYEIDMYRNECSSK
jgi:hypothetical protein